VDSISWPNLVQYLHVRLHEWTPGYVFAGSPLSSFFAGRIAVFLFSLRDASHHNWPHLRCAAGNALGRGVHIAICLHEPLCKQEWRNSTASSPSQSCCKRVGLARPALMDARAEASSAKLSRTEPHRSVRMPNAIIRRVNLSLSAHTPLKRLPAGDEGRISRTNGISIGASAGTLAGRRQERNEVRLVPFTFR
jgi:hypothetical protein